MPQPVRSAHRPPPLLRPRHVGHTMLFHCIDDYFGPFHREQASLHQQPFAASLAGGGLAFLLADTQIAACMQVIAGCVISTTRTLRLFSHVDCGAYIYFAGVDWQQLERAEREAVQIATLWRDLHLAETVIRDYASNFKHPTNPGWVAPELTIDLEVIDLAEHSVPEPASLEPALPLSRYRGVCVPRSAIRQ